MSRAIFPEVGQPAAARLGSPSPGPPVHGGDDRPTNRRRRQDPDRSRSPIDWKYLARLPLEASITRSSASSAPGSSTTGRSSGSSRQSWMQSEPSTSLRHGATAGGLHTRPRRRPRDDTDRGCHRDTPPRSERGGLGLAQVDSRPHDAGVGQAMRPPGRGTIGSRRARRRSGRRVGRATRST